MSGLTEERATMPHFAADYDALASVVHDLRGRLGVLEERVRMLEAGRPKPTWGKRCNLKPVPSEHAEFKALLAILQERDDAKHATELAESELAGERQEVEHLRGQLADAIERAEKTAAINDALRQRCHLAEDECDKLREALARATADAETYLRIGQRRGEENKQLRAALHRITDGAEWCGWRAKETDSVWCNVHLWHLPNCDGREGKTLLEVAQAAEGQGEG